MLSTNLSTLLKPYKQLINKHALALTYRALCFEKDLVIGCSPGAILETRCEHGIKEKVCVDATAFLAVMDSLPSEKEVEFTVESNVLTWKCGGAKGRLATIAVDEMPSIPPRNKKVKSFKPKSDFCKALLLGAVSCDSESLMSVGMFGIVFDGTVEPFAIYSSDNATVSCAYVEDCNPEYDGKMALAPDPARLLAAIIQPEEGTLQFEKDGVYYEDRYCRAIIKMVPPLQYDSMDYILQYDTNETIALIPQGAVSAFVKRAAALAESRRHVFIELSASNGQLGLTFAEGASSSEEVYLVEGLEVPDIKPILLDAMKMARALAHCSEICLDHMDRSVLVVRGKAPEFRYIISGRKQAEA